jgi:hypothetical protein
MREHYRVGGGEVVLDQQSTDDRAATEEREEAARHDRLLDAQRITISNEVGILRVTGGPRLDRIELSNPRNKIAECEPSSTVMSRSACGYGSGRSRT